MKWILNMDGTLCRLPIHAFIVFQKVGWFVLQPKTDACHSIITCFHSNQIPLFFFSEWYMITTHWWRHNDLPRSLSSCVLHPFLRGLGVAHVTQPLMAIVCASCSYLDCCGLIWIGVSKIVKPEPISATTSWPKNCQNPWTIVGGVYCILNFINTGKVTSIL